MTIDDLTLEEGRKLYFDRNGFSESDYDTRWIRIDFKLLPLYFPNSTARRRAIPLHDLHHVLTGYETNFLGEAEIGAWEIASGCKDYWAAWILNALAILLGFSLNPRRVMRAWRRGRNSRNLYGPSAASTFLSRKIGELKTELHLK
jgi:hypothetical protein